MQLARSRRQNEVRESRHKREACKWARQSAQRQRKTYTHSLDPASQLHTTRQDLVLSRPTALGVPRLALPVSCYTPARLQVTYRWHVAVPVNPLYYIGGVVSSADGDVCLWRCESARTDRQSGRVRSPYFRSTRPPRHRCIQTASKGPCQTGRAGGVIDVVQLTFLLRYR